MGFDHARTEEAEEIFEAVSVAGRGWVIGNDVGAVPSAAETNAITGLVADGLDLLSTLSFAGVEGRVDVDEFYGTGFHRLQYT